MAEINNPEFGVRRLDEHERIESFDCGDADLNDFIMNESIIYRNELLAVSYVQDGRLSNSAIGVLTQPSTTNSAKNAINDSLWVN